MLVVASIVLFTFGCVSTSPCYDYCEVPPARALPVKRGVGYGFMQNHYDLDPYAGRFFTSNQLLLFWLTATGIH